jgi:hypothetical protein
MPPTERAPQTAEDVPEQQQLLRGNEILLPEVERET